MTTRSSKERVNDKLDFIKFLYETGMYNSLSRPHSDKIVFDYNLLHSTKIPYSWAFQLTRAGLTQIDDLLFLSNLNISAREFAENSTYATPYPRQLKKQISPEELKVKQREAAKKYYQKNRDRIIAKVKERSKEMESSK
jgi:hypothetical protein